MATFSLDRIGQKNLRELPGNLFLKIRKELNGGIPNPAWKDIASQLDGDFEMDDTDMGRIESADDQGERFLQRLGTQGMTVEQFVRYAGQARLYVIVNLFDNVRIPVAIIRQPFYGMNVCEGELVELTVDATGFPPPRYQWYREDHGHILGATSNTICFTSVKPSDTGRYFCLVSNNPNWENAVPSSIVDLLVMKAKPLEIREHPNSFTVSKGGNGLMKCDVWGDGQIGFQWMKDGVDLTDGGGHFLGSQTNELRIYNVDSREWTGWYCCRIMRNEEVIYTNDATLQLSRTGPVKEYTATDKVALLMGAGDYRSDHQLEAPEKDVQSLAKIFVSLNFKVVSLYNLTKLEMIAAIDEFKHLVGKDVYCVFYFCGHGFEAANNCFLVPPDAPQGYDHTHCLSADSILFNILLPQRPKVCCMILDICRKNRKGPTPQIVHKDIQAGSHIVCYGTSQGLAAYEEKKHGILVNHLKKILIQDICIESVFQKLREEIRLDPKLQQKDLDDKIQFRQIPEVLTNLSEPERSFHDPIVYTGHTTEFMTRKDIWEKAHEKPPDRDLIVSFGNFNVKLRLNFQQEFSNVLKIYLSVIDPGPTFSCQAHVNKVPQDVASQARVIKIRSGTKTALCQNYVTLYDIQRLKSDLKIEITVTCQMDFGLKSTKSISENLDYPLVSRLQLWKERSIVSGMRQLDVKDDNDEDNK